jgi:uncharacterized repeat protein (TIGR03803 family)
MSKRIVLPAVLLLATLGQSLAQGQSYNVLHSFSSADGNTLYGGLVVSGSSLYGVALYGGAYSKGTIFSLNADGSNFHVLRNLGQSTGDSAYPWGGLALIGSTLYGTTQKGGASGKGTVFSIKTNGSGYNFVKSFSGSDGSGGSTDALTVVGSTLYGTTIGGGTGGNGTVFSLNTQNSAFTSLASIDSYGNSPYSRPIVTDSYIYGTTSQGGGSSAIGTIYRTNLDGSGLTNLHIFNSELTEGYDLYDYGGLVLSGSKLYGTAYLGGSSNRGTVFSMETDGSDFQVLHTFTDGSEAACPYAGLTLAGSTLYGTTCYGGTYGCGTIFQINMDGSGYQVLHNFNFPNGANPFGPLTLAGSTLYGTTSSGTVFSWTIPEPSTLTLLTIGAAGMFFWKRKRHKAQKGDE